MHTQYDYDYRLLLEQEDHRTTPRVHGILLIASIWRQSDGAGFINNLRRKPSIHDWLVLLSEISVGRNVGRESMELSVVCSDST